MSVSNGKGAEGFGSHLFHFSSGMVAAIELRLPLVVHELEFSTEF